MARRSLPEINAGSMADIAFLLLIFFLVTTTMQVDSGISRKLPAIEPDDIVHPPVNERNVYVVLINKDNQLAVKGELMEVEYIRDQVKEFFTNPSRFENLSDQVNVEDKLTTELNKENPDQEKIATYKAIIEQIGPDVTISKGVVSLQNDRGTTYGKYLEVQNEIVGAINDLRDGISKEVWGKKFDELNGDQQELVKTIYPFAISEAEPRSLAKK
ncbi:MAG: biopolymer transporter ExbD [Bacteroidales bacterium]|nr:biopolymer transporter ExbD [Bacteroidales bacterium]